jgi:hypothetical protein
MVDGSLRKWNTDVASVAPRSSAIDPELAETHNLKGLRAPNFYVVEMPLSNPEGILKPGMVGVARIYGPRRSVAGLLLAAARRALVRKAW